MDQVAQSIRLPCRTMPGALIPIEPPNRAFMVRIQCVIFVLMLCGGIGCNSRVKDDTAEVQMAALERQFGVRWPKSTIRKYSATWQYQARLDENSSNSETICRIELSGNAYAEWEKSNSHQFSVYEGLVVPYEERLSKKYAWWIPHIYSGADIKYLRRDIGQGSNSRGRLEIFVAQTNHIHLMFIHSHVRVTP